MVNIQTLQSGCSQTITVTAIDPDVVPVSMTLDKTSGVAPLTVTVTLQYKNNTVNTVTNSKGLLWIGDTPTSFSIPSVAGGATVNISQVVSISTAGTWKIKPEIPDSCTQTGLIYGNPTMTGVVSTADKDLIKNFSVLTPVPTPCQYALSDLNRNALDAIDAGDLSIIQNYILGGSFSGYQVVGRNVVTLASQAVTVTAIPTGTLQVNSTPSSAEVFIDGVDQNVKTNTTLQAPAGTHTLTLKLTGYQDWSQSVTITSGQTTTVSATLVYTTGFISVSSTPSGAEIWLDDVDTGMVTSTSLNFIPAGTHTILLKLSGYQDWSQTVTLAAGQFMTVSATLVPATTGTLNITSQPSGATVILNGAAQPSLTPTTISNILPGNYTLILRLAGYIDWSPVTITIPIIGGTTTNINAILVAVVLPVQSSCALPQNVPAGQDGSATVTVLAGNVAKNIAFTIQKAGVLCATSTTNAIPGDSTTHTYTVTIPSSGCLSSISGTSVNISIQMILV